MEKKDKVRIFINDKRLTEKDKELMQFTYAQVLDDGNNWDYMTGKEINLRLTHYLADKTPERMIRLFSCLRLAQIYFLKKKDGKKWSTLVLEEQGEKMIFVFGTKKHIPKEMLEDCSVGQMSFREFVCSFKGLVDVVVLNPDTQPLYIPMGQIDELFAMMDDIENGVDEMMETGIAGDSLNELTFDRFWGRNLYCEKKDGMKVSGEASSYDYDGDDLVLKVESKDGIVRIKMVDVAFIKDMGYPDEE